MNQVGIKQARSACEVGKLTVGALFEREGGVYIVLRPEADRLFVVRLGDGLMVQLSSYTIVKPLASGDQVVLTVQ